jgi:TnpA family transposase
MAKRKLLKVHDRQKVFDIPADENSLIRHYSLSPADRLEIELRRREHNRLGFAVQLCLMRYPGRVLGAEETPPRFDMLLTNRRRPRSICALCTP